MLGEFVTRLLVLVLGYAYPAIECFKTVEKKKVEIEELRFWCQYWIVVAFLTVFERIGDTFLSWLPMYDELKLTLLIGLWYPKTKGSDYLYNTLLRPFMSRHETELERKIQELRYRAWDLALFYWQNYTELGQTKFFEMIQYLGGQSSRIKNGNQKSGKNKNWTSTKIERDSRSEYDQSDDYPIPESPSNFKLQQAFFKNRHTKPHK
ncbi:putative HVA22-like protein g [Durio zibethinus]|uniref:HVA22-like protein n=1 Tax=Durio zibethinus TaxID=66656 RepID=A0A6P5Z4C5_DURZI|nr:putative HVA22-like protein g [Durio zibethinus]XP_022747618.1 putative HVA22-like protein g [Durio zibethinus]